MKKEYKLKDKVWIHNGEKNLVEGRVVEIIDLTHLNEGHSADEELYIVEIETGIDNIYEVRSYELISPDAKGPITLFRNKDTRRANRYFKKIGIDAPVGEDKEDPLDIPILEGEEMWAQEAINNAPTKPKRKFYRKPK